MKKIFTILLISVFALPLLSQSVIPKYELRGAWIATVTNLDWPSAPGLPVSEQKEELKVMLDELKTAGTNVIYFQIRCECDALYESSIEPWSYWLTGTQGQAPSPMYDPLEFAIEETHKRGMELHAWFNPYRAVKTVGYYTQSVDHISNTHPEWIITVDDYKMIDPGLPEVDDYVTSVFVDVASRYTDIDGVHMDDYFYPYTPISNQDSATFANYPRGFTDIGDWRRDNINRMVQRLNDTLMAINPELKWGVSPFGIWKPGVPPGISGMNAYDVLYCDPIAWLNDQSVDYLTPQLYWPFGGGQDYGTLMPWWADSISSHGRHFYPGQAAYRIESSFSASEIPSQISANRNNPDCHGSVFFEAIDFLDNPKGFTDSLKDNYYRIPSIPPVMTWKETTPPEAPSNLQFQLDAASGKYQFTWDEAPIASDGDSAHRYVVYRFASSPAPGDINIGNHIMGIAGDNFLPVKYSHFGGPAGNYYVVTSIDNNNNESGISNVLQVTQAPGEPSLLTPANNTMNTGSTVTITWEGDNLTGAYHLQIATDPAFNTIIVEKEATTEESYTLTSLLPQQTYYWRVAAQGHGGFSSFTDAWNFTTGFPTAPMLADPPHATVLATNTPTLKWFSTPNAESYHLWVAKGTNINPDFTVVDEGGITDTLYTCPPLEENAIYAWQVQAVNQYGLSPLSEIWAFKSGVTSVEDRGNLIPEDFEIDQNYPNPFNPSTTINFGVPETVTARLTVFNLLGEKMIEPLNDLLSPGYYSINLDLSRFDSGIYFYRFEAGRFNKTYKMVLLK